MVVSTPVRDVSMCRGRASRNEHREEGTDIPFPPAYVIPTDSNYITWIGEVIGEYLKGWLTDMRTRLEITLAVEEALANAMKHGNQMKPYKTVRVAYLVKGDVFYVRIADEGNGFDPGSVPDPTLEENLERPCGRGLRLMRHFMDEVHFLEGGTVVFMSKRRVDSSD